jgi:hypothetical protein
MLKSINVLNADFKIVDRVFVFIDVNIHTKPQAIIFIGSKVIMNEIKTNTKS